MKTDSDFCRRCGGPIFSEMAHRTGYGDGCRRRVYRGARALEASGNPIALRAAGLLRTATLVPIKPHRVWRVVGRTGTYLVSKETCTCKGATYRPTANTCYHSVAVAVLAA